MKRLLFGIIAVLTVCTLAFAQDAGRAVQRFMNFAGLNGEAVLSAGGAIPTDIMNFDLVNSGGRLLLRQRPGFASLGEGLPNYPVQHIAWHTPDYSTKRMLVACGNQLMAWDEANNKFVSPTVDVFAGTCIATNGSTTIIGNGTNWLGLIQYDVDTIGVGDNRYLIHRILGDTLLELTAVFAQSTDSALACTVWTGGTASENTVFERTTTKKHSTMFEDTLCIVDGDSLIKYTGGGGVDLMPSLKATGMNGWDRNTMTVQLTGVGENSVPDRWYQIENPSNLLYTLALYCIDESWTFRCDTTMVSDWLAAAADTNLTLQVWPTDSVSFGHAALACDIDTAVIESLLTANKNYLTINGESANDQYQYYRGAEDNHVLSFRRKRSIYNYGYIFRHKVKVTSVDGWPATGGGGTPKITLDSLSWLSTVATDTSVGGTTNSGEAGSYLDQMPVVVDTLDNGDTVIVVANYGFVGNWAKDSTIWDRYYNYYDYCPGCPSGVGNYWDIDSMVEVHMGMTGVAADTADSIWPGTAYNTLNYEWQIFAVGDSTGMQKDSAGVVFKDDGDSLYLNRMSRMGDEGDPVFSVSLATIEYDYGIVFNAGDRNYYAGHSHKDSSNVFAWSKHNLCDSILGFDYANKNSGSPITAVSGWDNYVFLHMPDGIAAAVLNTESNTDVDNPVVAGTPNQMFQTEAQYGAVNQNALVNTSQGDVFVATTGVFLFSGGPLTKLSSPIDHYFADSIDATQWGNVSMAKEGDLLYFSYTTTGSTENDRTLVYSQKTQQWWKYDVGASVFLSDVSLDARSGTYFGSPTNTTGRVLKFGGTTDTSEYIRSRWVSERWVGPAPYLRKNILLSHIWGTFNTTAICSLSITKNNAASPYTPTVVRPGTAGWDVYSQPVGPNIQSESFYFELQLDSATECEVGEIDFEYGVSGGAQR